MAYIKLSTGGTAISGGAASGCLAPEAFDGLIETGFMDLNGYVSSQQGTAALNSYLGYTKSAPVMVKQIKMYNATGNGAQSQHPNSVIVKGSNDGGSSWTAVQTFTGLNTTRYAWNTCNITDDYSFTTWAVFCNEALSPISRWGVGELEFWGEAGETPPDPPSSFYSYIMGGE